jgi:hypothetical protein
MELIVVSGRENLAEEQVDIKQIKKQIDMLDRRLDNVDSMVSAVAERVLNQPLTINLTCPKCGNRIEIAIIGTQKPSH